MLLGLVDLFNNIPTFLGYLIPKPLQEKNTRILFNPYLEK